MCQSSSAELFFVFDFKESLNISSKNLTRTFQSNRFNTKISIKTFQLLGLCGENSVHWNAQRVCLEGTEGALECMLCVEESEGLRGFVVSVRVKMRFENTWCVGQKGISLLTSAM